MSVKDFKVRSTIFQNGRKFGDIGAYERLAGIVEFEIDPDIVCNSVITDIKNTATNSNGKVEFSSDIIILRPRDASKRNGKIFLDVVNRGRPTIIRMTDVQSGPDPIPTAQNNSLFDNQVAPYSTIDSFYSYPEIDNAGPFPGDGWLLMQGYTLVFCGWQHDVLPSGDLLRLRTPIVQTEGSAVSGKVLCLYEPIIPGNVMLLTSSLGNAPVNVYPAVDVNEPTAILTVRDHYFGPSRTIDRDRWTFARETDNGEIQQDARFVYYKDGFESGKLYEVIYTASDAMVSGLGFAAIRDVVSFLRYGSATINSPLNESIDYAFTFGASQSGRFLRHFMYLGMNTDEEARIVFDGIHVHIAGARLIENNWRFGQPAHLSPYSPVNLFPYADIEQIEPVTGQTDSILKEMFKSKKIPKIISTNSSFEYWGNAAALTHVSLDGSKDLEIPENVRIYLISGTQHSAGPVQLTNLGLRGRAVGYLNSIDYRPFIRACIKNLDRWVSEGSVPPDSLYPRVDDKTGVMRDSLRELYESFPGPNIAANLLPFGRLEFDKYSEYKTYPLLVPELKEPYADIVSAVDIDGNEIAGVRLPDISVPLATYTGWNQVLDSSSDIPMFLTGSTIVFPKDGHLNDPRKSINQRYKSKDDYLNKIKTEAIKLSNSGYILHDDIENIVQKSDERWDEFTQLSG
ncbi:MAG: hypothetical protein CL785_00120 [Chloroflexi bacterium]|nr:hypothetical protein [Chloroflexota bacterium]|tara:strand:+ start:19087 stop:21135 length:2049 start_codon:yes stop_codon:yes gene_type:complete